MPAATILFPESFVEFNNTNGRGGRSSLSGTYNWYPATVGLTPSATNGVAWAYSTLGASSEQPILFTRDTVGGVVHFTLTFSGADGKLRLRQGFVGTLIATGTTVIPLDGFHHFDAKFTVGTGVGAFAVKVDGVTEAALTQTGITLTGGGSSLNREIRLDGHVCDVVITDGADFKGDRAVAAIPLSTPGTYSAGVAVGEGTLIECVDENITDSDTSYIRLDNTSLPRKVSFNVTLPTCTAIEAIMPRAVARKDDSGVNSARLLVISGATESDGGADKPVGSSYGTYPQFMEALYRILTEDPNNPGNPFTSAQAIEVGYSRTV